MRRAMADWLRCGRSLAATTDPLSTTDTQEPIQLNAFPLVFGGRSVYGSLTGTPIDSEDSIYCCQN
jgi:D-arabinose 1-dehydrogenase-like Zn-dependent alcohol dehydrogenase